MSKRNKIIYWIATVWLALGMIAGGIAQLFQTRRRICRRSIWHYTFGLSRSIFCTILGVWKIFGVMALFVPSFRYLKEWAYAGFFFVMSGAIYFAYRNGRFFERNISVLVCYWS